VDEIRAQLVRDPAARVDSRQLTVRFGVNRTSLRSEFKRYTGQTMSEYRNHLRWTRVMEAVMTTELPLKRIAHQAGFRHAANFSTAFRRRFGSSPAAMRKRSRSK
jgi:AraC-like DNA-binding protein